MLTEREREDNNIYAQWALKNLKFLSKLSPCWQLQWHAKVIIDCLNDQRINKIIATTSV